MAYDWKLTKQIPSGPSIRAAMQKYLMVFFLQAAALSAGGSAAFMLRASVRALSL